MEDLFYFTKSQVSLEDVNSIAVEQGLSTWFRGEASDRELNISILGEIHSTWCLFGSDYDSFGPLDGAFVQRYQPVSSVMVTFSLNRTFIVVQLIERVLALHGGWIGLDDDWVRPDDDTVMIYDSSTIYDVVEALSQMGKSIEN